MVALKKVVLSSVLALAVAGSAFCSSIFIGNGSTEREAAFAASGSSQVQTATQYKKTALFKLDQQNWMEETSVSSGAVLSNSAAAEDAAPAESALFIQPAMIRAGN